MNILKKHKSYESIYVHDSNRVYLDQEELDISVYELGFRIRIQSDNCLTETIGKYGYLEYSGNSKEVLEWTDENFSETWSFSKRGNERFYYLKNREDAVKFIFRFGMEEMVELNYD